MTETDSTTQLATPPERRPRKKALKNLMRREGVWYFHKLVNGKREYSGRKTPFSLDTRDEAVAKARRDAILKAANGSEVDKILGQRTGPAAATMAKIFEAYLAADYPREATRKNNINALKLVIRKARGAEPNFETMQVDELTLDLVQNYQDAVVAAARAAGVEDESEAMLQIKYSANRELAQGRSIFANEKAFRRLHLPFPTAFREADEFKVRRDHTFTPMSQVEMDLFAAKSKEIRATQPGVYLTYLLMQWCGLRNEEVSQCKPADWLVRSGKSVDLDIRPRDYYLPKGTPGKVPVPIWVVAELEDLAGGREWLIPGETKTERYDVTHRDINDWIRLVYQEAIAAGVLPPGIEVRTSYDFRKQAGSILYEQTHDIMAVQRFLRHESPVTTLKWYANLIKKLPAIAELTGR